MYMYKLETAYHWLVWPHHEIFFRVPIFFLSFRLHSFNCFPFYDRPSQIAGN